MIRILFVRKTNIPSTRKIANKARASDQMIICFCFLTIFYFIPILQFRNRSNFVNRYFFYIRSIIKMMKERWRLTL